MPQDDTATAVRTARMDDPFLALGTAAKLLGRVPPYRDVPMGPMIATLSAQIARGHYLFAHRGKQITGYLGWAMCSPEVARDWVQGHRLPMSSDCVSGSEFVLLTITGTDPASLRCMIRSCRRQYPGQRAVFRREYAGRRPDRIASVRNMVPPPVRNDVIG